MGWPHRVREEERFGTDHNIRCNVWPKNTKKTLNQHFTEKQVLLSTSNIWFGCDADQKKTEWSCSDVCDGSCWSAGEGRTKMRKPFKSTHYRSSQEVIASSCRYGEAGAPGAWERAELSVTTRVVMERLTAQRLWKRSRVAMKPCWSCSVSCAENKQNKNNHKLHAGHFNMCSALSTCKHSVNIPNVWMDVLISYLLTLKPILNHIKYTNLQYIFFFFGPHKITIFSGTIIHSRQVQ